MEVSEAVKHGVSKREGATQKCEFWGQIWGRNRAGGAFWGIILAFIVR